MKDENEVKKLISFVYATELNEIAKRKLNSIKEENNFKYFKISFVKTFSSTRSFLVIKNILNNTKQTKALEEFIENIQKLIAELNLVRTQTEVEKKLIREMNDDLALSAFKNGIKFELKGIIFAARPKNFEEARLVASEDTQIFAQEENSETTSEGIVRNIITIIKLGIITIIKQKNKSQNPNSNVTVIKTEDNRENLKGETKVGILIIEMRKISNM